MKPWQMMRSFGQVAMPSSYDDVVLADSPAGYWKMDETSGSTVVDYSGNARHGTYFNSPTLSSGGATFDGINQYATFADAAFDVIGNAGQSYTFELFVTVQSGISSPVALMDKTKTASPADWNALQYVSGAPHFQIYDGSTNPIATSGTLVLDTEAMIHAVRNAGSSQLILYLNGSAVATASASSAIDVDNAIALCIGARQAGTDRFAKIKVRRAAVYLSALDASKIAAHYAAR